MLGDDAGLVAKVLLHGDEVRKGGRPMIVAIKEFLAYAIFVACIYIVLVVGGAS